MSHQTSRMMIANAFPFEERDAHFVERLYTPLPLSSQGKVQLILETPFALNNQSMVCQLDGEEAQSFLNHLVEDTASLASLVTFNAAYAFLLKGEWQKSFELFIIAGKKGMRNGYLEAAQIIIDGRKIYKDGISYNVGDNGCDFEAITGLLKAAGSDGKWFLANCYRYGRKVPQNRKETYMI